MEKIDFQSKAKDYPHLDKKDIQILDRFFNKSENIELLSQIEAERKKTMNIIRIIAIVLFLVLLFIGFNNPDLIIHLIVFFVFGYGTLKKIVPRIMRNKTIKKNMIGKFVKYFDNNIDFDSEDGLFNESIGKVKEKTGLLSSYDRIKAFEDSIQYDYEIQGKNTIEIMGVEIWTEDKHTDDDGNTHRTTSDHCYMTKLKFLEPRFKIDESIRLEKDIFEAGLGLLTNKRTIFLLLFSIPWIVAFLNSNITNELKILGLLVLLGVIYGIFKYKTSNRIELENQKFEKMFDVYCEDGIQARKVLTQSFMDRIVEFAKKFPEQSYELYLNNDEIYIKQILKEDYLEFDVTKNVFENVQDYVTFYKQIKQTKNLIQDLGLYYYDKESFSKQIN